MELHVRFKNVSEASHERIEQDIRRYYEKHKIGPRLEKYFQPDVLTLYAEVERNPHHEHLYRVRFRLHVPHTILVTVESDYDLELAIHRAMEELGRRVDRHIHKLKKDAEWRRKGRRRKLHQLKMHLETVPSQKKRDFIDLIRPHLPHVEQIVKRELTWLRSEGNLSPDYPTTRDILDEALVRANRNLPDKPEWMDAEQWLIKHALAVLEEETKKYLESVSSLHTEIRLPPDAIDVSEKMVQEEFMEFYQPDDMLRIEDMLPAPEDADPEVRMEHRERSHLLFHAMRKLPVAWRRAVELVHAEGYSEKEAAELLGTDEETIRHWLRLADTYLRAKLTEKGYTLPEADEDEPAIQALLAKAPPPAEEDEAELHRELEALAEE